MKYRTLGRTGINVSEVSFGTWALGSPVYGSVGTSDAHRAIRGALDAGITFFDTAPLYGNKDEDGIAEKILGQGLGADRDKVAIATKFGRYPTLGHMNTYFHAEGVTKSVEDSLRRLGTDRIDVLFFHSPQSREQIHDDIWAALEKLKKSGKVRAVGHSISWFPETQQAARDWAAERKIDVIQVVYSLFYRESEKLIADLGAAGIGVVARESLANGFLGGAFTKDIVFPEGSLNARYSREEIIARVETADRYKALLVRRDIRSLAQAAMRWVLDNPNVSLVLAGSRKIEEIVDCAAASDAAPYSAAELAQARALHTRDWAPA
ncbi:MAG: aldo/keto reductase [Verrucomicrobia bacterium]|nr:aldo/keto reductase [Verrucomicrobiota bacterium]